MKLLRIINKQGLFIRDDFTFNEAAEIGLYVEPAQGFYLPKWDFVNEVWVEGGTPPDLVNQEPSMEDRLASVESTQSQVIDVLAEITVVTL